MDVFSALAYPTRRNILRLLAVQGMLSASEIYSHYQSTAPAISQHLQTLNQANLVTVKQKGNKRLYVINVNTLNEVKLWVNEINSIWEQRFERLEKLIK